MIYIYKGKNPDGMSMDLVARQVAAGIPGSEVVSSLHMITAADTVINVLMEDVSKVLDLRRYVGKFKYLTIMACNAEELPAPDLVRSLLYHTEDVLVLHSEHSRKIVSDVLREYLSPAMRMALSRNIVTELYGVEPGFMRGTNDKCSWIAPFNRCNSVQKNVPLHAKVTETLTNYLAVKGSKVETTLYLPENGFGTTPPSIYRVEAQPKNRSDYKENARKFGMFICTSNFESFGIYYLKLLLSGVVGVFLRKPWVEKLLPGYPLMANNQEELQVIALRVFHSYEMYRIMILDEWGPRIREMYSLDRFQKRIANLIGE